MVAIAVQWRRVVVVDGPQRREVLLSLTSSVSDSLRNEGIDSTLRPMLVVTADGAPLDLSSPPTVADGALLTVLDLEAVRASVQAAENNRSIPTTDYAGPLWSVVASVAMIAAFAAIVGLVTTHSAGVVPVVRIGLVVVLLALTVVAALHCMRRVGDSRAGGERAAVRYRLFAPALFAPAALGFAGGVIAIPGDLVAAGHLAVFTGLLVAAIAQAAVGLRAAGTTFAGATGVVTISLIVLAALWGSTLMLGVDAGIAAALAAGAAPVALRALPALSLDVPEGQLLEYSTFMRNRWTVRGAIPPESRPVAAHEIDGTMSRARLQLRAGTVVFGLVAAASIPVVFAAEAPDALVGIARLVLAGAIISSFLLYPRQANDPLSRWAPRAAAGAVGAVVALSFARSSGGVVPLVSAVVLLLVALGVAATIVALTRGVRSLGVSRLADVVENITTVVALPAAIVAAGLIGILRGVAS